MKLLRIVSFAYVLIATCTAGLFSHTQALSAELIMVEQRACPWCARWKEEIGVVYNKTQEGKQAPLRMVNIHEDWPDDLEKVSPGRFTPTFILVQDGLEVERIFGYQGEEAFWFQLGQMLKKINATPKS